MDLNERKIHGLLLHSRGYNCAQSVLLSFADYTGLQSALAARLAMGLGGGIGAQGQACGVVLGMSLVLGLIRGEDPAIKPKVNAEVRELTRRFRERNKGRWLCSELKSASSPRSCDDLIADGIEILHQYLEEPQQ